MGTYIYREESGYDERFDAAGDDAAEARAGELLRGGDWGTERSSFRVRAQVARIEAHDGAETECDWRTVMVQFDPPVPPCSERQQSHDFDDGPAYGHGAGTVTTDTCRECSTRRVTDTWATDWATGEPFTSVAYETAALSG
jgi:hypothetical protein